MKRTLKYAGGLVLIAGFVTLLTIIFSFVGAFFCAGLFGMMLGATKVVKGLAPFISVICPLVLLGVLLTEKTELAGRQVFIVVALCFGTFWVLYLGAVGLLASEKQAASLAATSSEIAGSTAASNVDSRPPPAALPEVRLEELEGNWCCEICGSDGSTFKRILEIKGDVLMVSTVSTDGQICSRCRGRLRLVNS